MNSINRLDGQIVDDLSSISVDLVWFPDRSNLA